MVNFDTKDLPINLRQCIKTHNRVNYDWLGRFISLPRAENNILRPFG